MKTEQEVIEEIAQLMQNGEIDREKGYIDCSEFNYKIVIKHGIQRLAGAKALHNAGYRKQGDTVREFVEKVLKIGSKRPLCLFNEYGEGYSDCIKNIKKVAKEYGVEVKE